MAHSEEETWFCIVFFYVSGLLIMLSISNLIMLVMKADSARTTHLFKVSNFEKYAKYRQLPTDLTRRVKSFYEYQWELLEGTEEEKVSFYFLLILKIEFKPSLI